MCILSYKCTKLKNLFHRNCHIFDLIPDKKIPQPENRLRYCIKCIRYITQPYPWCGKHSVHHHLPQALQEVSQHLPSPLLKVF